MMTLRLTNRERYAKAVRHMFNHPEKYKVMCRGRDYSADIKNKATGCAWYIEYSLV